MKLIRFPMELGLMSVGMGTLGEKLGSEGLTNAGAVTGKFIAPAINISMGGYLIKQLRGLNNEVREKEKEKKKKQII